MATIKRGKLKGKQATLLQWANDWFSVEVEGVPKIVTPTSLILTSEEVELVRNTFNVGMLWTLFTLSDDGIFKRRKQFFTKTGQIPEHNV
jgi:hypothetical protein